MSTSHLGMLISDSAITSNPFIFSLKSAIARSAKVIANYNIAAINKKLVPTSFLYKLFVETFCNS